MPIYEVKCAICGDIQDIVRKVAERESHLPECCGRKMHNIISATRINVDITPYRAVAVDKKTGERPLITSRHQHREFLKRNDYVEMPDLPRKREVRGDFDVKKELIDATKQVLGKLK
jgi:putative FmdB family regulatory protein